MPEPLDAVIVVVRVVVAKLKREPLNRVYSDSPIDSSLVPRVSAEVLRLYNLQASIRLDQPMTIADLAREIHSHLK